MRFSEALRHFTWFVAIGVAVLSSSGRAEARNFDGHEGYLTSVEKERDQTSKEMEIFLPPPPNGPSLHQKIFNPQLSREFREKYEEKFGRTEQERVYNSPNKSTYYNDLYGYRGSAQEVDEERRKFGEFMMRRLAEFHVDNYAKNDPKVRPVWEAKERLSKLDVQVGPSMHLDVRYSIAGNSLDVIIRNPWVRSKATLQMDPGKVGPAQIEEVIYSLGRDVTKTVTLETDYKSQDGIIAFTGRKSVTERLSTSLTSATFTKDSGKTQRESLYLAGLSYTY